MTNNLVLSQRSPRMQHRTGMSIVEPKKHARRIHRDAFHLTQKREERSDFAGVQLRQAGP